MSNLSVSRLGEVIVFDMAKSTAADIIKLHRVIEQDIRNTLSHEIYRAIINTRQTVYTVRQAAQVLNDYEIIGELPGHNYKIAILIHGNPATLADDASKNWEDGGLKRVWSVVEAIVQTADVLSANAELQNNAIIRNNKVEVIYGEEKALNWARLTGSAPE